MPEQRWIFFVSHHTPAAPLQARYLADQYGSFAVRNGTLQQARRTAGVGWRRKKETSE